MDWDEMEKETLAREQANMRQAQAMARGDRKP